MSQGPRCWCCQEPGSPAGRGGGLLQTTCLAVNWEAPKGGAATSQRQVQGGRFPFGVSGAWLAEGEVSRLSPSLASYGVQVTLCGWAPPPGWPVSSMRPPPEAGVILGGGLQAQMAPFHRPRLF